MSSTKGGASPKTYFIGIIIFTLVVVGGVAWMGNLSLNSNGPHSIDAFNKTFNKYEQVLNQTQALQSSIEGADTDFGAFGVLNSLINSSWNTLKLLFVSLGFMRDAYGGLNTFFGVPMWMISLLSGVVIIVIAFAIWGAIFQRDL